MDHENPSLRALINDSAEDDPFQEILFKVDDMYRYYEGFAEKATTIDVRRIKKGVCHFNLARGDRELVAIQYLYGDRAGASPLVRADNRRPIYGILQQEFDALWDANAG